MLVRWVQLPVGWRLVLVAMGLYVLYLEKDSVERGWSGVV